MQLFTVSFTLILSPPTSEGCEHSSDVSCGLRRPSSIWAPSLRLCSAACGASGHRAVPSSGTFPRRLGIRWKYLPFMGTGDKLRNFKQCLFSLQVLLVKEVLSCFGKLGGRDKTDGRLSNTKKCVTKNWRRTLGDDLKTCVYNIYGNVRS